MTLNLQTDGTDGYSDVFGTTTDVGGSFTFLADPDPTLSTAQNSQVTAGGSVNLPVITVSASGGSKITAVNDLRLRIPAGLGALWDTTVTSVTLGGTAAAKADGTALGVSYGDGDKTFILDVTADFSPTDTLTITGLRLLSSAASTGHLDLSYDGGGTYPVEDDKLISVLPAVFVWKGGGTADWALGTNWVGESAPTLGTQNVRIPTGASPFPEYAAAGTLAVNNLEVQSGATLKLTGGALGLTVNGTFVLTGTLILDGDETLAGTPLPPSSGTVEFTGTATTGTGLTSFYNLTVSAGTFTPSANFSVYGKFSQTGGVVNAGAVTWTIHGNWSRSAGTFNAQTSTVSFAGSGATTVANNTIFNNLSVTTPGKWVYFTQGSAQTLVNLTVTGASSSLVKLRSSGAGAYTLNATAATVSYADISYCTINPGATPNSFFFFFFFFMAVE